MELHQAASAGDPERVRLLVEQGADKDEVDHSGNTPLYLASRFGHLIVVQYLVEKGTSLDKVNNRGETPLLEAAYEGHLEDHRRVTILHRMTLPH